MAVAAKVALIIGSFVVTEVLWRNRRAIYQRIKKLGNWAKQQFGGQEAAEEELSIAVDEEEGMEAIFCPISHEIMRDPVITPYGHCFERANIESWIERRQDCPITRNTLRSSDLKPCHSMRLVIEQFLKLRETHKKLD
jgi:hypothetical protein